MQICSTCLIVILSSVSFMVYASPPLFSGVLRAELSLPSLGSYISFFEMFFFIHGKL